MKIGIYYFSGTGNTRWVASKIKDIYASKNFEVEMHSIEDNPDVKDLDLLIVGGPIYATNMPEKLIRWVIRNIPETTTCKAIVFSTSAGLKKAKGTISIGKKLQNKGYNVLGTFKYELPRNYYLSGYAQTPEEKIPMLFEATEKQISKDFSTIDQEKNISIEEKTLGMDLAAESMSVLTRFMGKSFSISEDCIKCGKCEKECPTQNININGKPNYKLNCMLCTRCIHSCPTNAIRYKSKKFPQYKINK